MKNYIKKWGARSLMLNILGLRECERERVRKNFVVVRFVEDFNSIPKCI